jgi:hypothetical protein
MGLAPEEMQMAVAQIAMDPMSRVPVAKKNDVAAMDVDIIIEEMPDVVTLQQEQFAELVSLANAQVIFPPEVYVEASGLRNKQRLLEMLKGGGEMSPEQQQQQQQQQEMAQMAADLEMRAKAAQAQKDEATAQKTVVETAVMAADAMEPKVEKVSGEPR